MVTFFLVFTAVLQKRKLTASLAFVKWTEFSSVSEKKARIYTGLFWSWRDEA